MKFAIVSGGTGGHIYPGIAIAEEIKRRIPSAEILFLGSEEGLEKDLIPRAGYAIKLIKARALLRKISYKAISAPFVSSFGFFQALIILKKFSPRALISTGGYASMPAVLAAKICSIPIYIHEQNVLPGFTNRFFMKWAKKVFLSFEASKKFMDGIVTGNPIRREIIEYDREKARRNLKISSEEILVIVMGGSQGARRINEVMVSTLPLINNDRLKVLHIVGTRDAALVDKWLTAHKNTFYQKVDYMYDIAEALAAADLVISRAGATAIAEFLVKGIPMVLVPFPFSAEGHQELNAKVVAEAGAALVVKEINLTPEKIVSLLAPSNLNLKIMKDNCKILARPKAAEEIINAIL